MKFFRGITPNQEYLQLTPDIYYHSPVKETVFGPHQAAPDFMEFLSFANTQAFTIGHANYNHLHLSTQVPARHRFIIDKALVITYKYWSNINILEVNPNYPFFGKFSNLEHMFLDALINFESIIFDGYFETTEDLLRGIVFRMNDLSKTHTLNKKLILQEARKANPKISQYI